MVSYVDIFPTFLEWTGNDQHAPKGLAGQSILPILEKSELAPESEWKQHIFGSHKFHEVTNYWPRRVLRTRRYKYHRNVVWRLDFSFSADLYGSLTWDGIRNSQTRGKEGDIMVGGRKLKDYIFRPLEELYDLDEDPLELVSLASEKKWEQKLLTLRAQLEKWQDVTLDPWLYRDRVSKRFFQHHLDAGMIVPDQFDLDLNNVRTK